MRRASGDGFLGNLGQGLPGSVHRSRTFALRETASHGWRGLGRDLLSRPPEWAEVDVRAEPSTLCVGRTPTRHRRSHA